MKDLYLNHPHVQHVEKQVEQLIRLPRKIRMPGLFICADSGIGKTHLLRRIERRHPAHEDGSRHCRPVLYVQVPAAVRVRDLRHTLFDEAGIAYRDTPRQTPETILRTGLAAAGVRLILLDEIHIIEHQRYRTRVHLRDYIRCLSNSTQLPVVLSGTGEFERALTQDPQLSSRYPMVRLPRWTEGPEFMAFLQGYQRACPLRLPSQLAEPQFMRALLKQTKGITDQIIRCLQAAALVGIRQGIERISIDNLEWWKDPPAVGSAYGTSDEYAASELAAAWLADTREKPAPLQSMGPVSRGNRSGPNGEGGI